MAHASGLDMLYVCYGGGFLFKEVIVELMKWKFFKSIRGIFESIMTTVVGGVHLDKSLVLSLEATAFESRESSQVGMSTESI